MSIVTAQQIGLALHEALGLPKNTISFTLRVQAGRIVTVECEYAPENDAFITKLAEFDLVPRQQNVETQPQSAEVIGYDAWLWQRNEAAHRQLMAHSVGIDYGK